MAAASYLFIAVFCTYVFLSAGGPLSSSQNPRDIDDRSKHPESSLKHDDVIRHGKVSPPPYDVRPTNAENVKAKGTLNEDNEYTSSGKKKWSSLETGLGIGGGILAICVGVLVAVIIYKCGPKNTPSGKKKKKRTRARKFHHCRALELYPRMRDTSLID
ncbi:hypothetical protein V1264_015521 [Littorina saxatilis]|uniref:Transmembrane protein n=1 Tax=Littorina saxatilis TaxID=31220 RepID=A0AAN9BL83_9CAEN